MKLSDLTAYADRKYRMREQHKWEDFPGFSVLCHPQTGKWAALLMRQWDPESGSEIQRCDMKCGEDALSRFQRPYLSAPFRMRGNKWIGISLDERTESEIVFQLLDQAVAAGSTAGYTIVLESQVPASETEYRDTALPFTGSAYRPPQEDIPEKLRAMRRLFDYGRQSPEARAKNFYRQAKFMADYTDDVPWSGYFSQYFPTYHDLTTQQLRGYFTWRAHVRAGDFQPIATSAVYIYLYELLNGIGADSPEDSLRKMREFEAGYLDSGIGDPRIYANLRRWMLEFAVLHALPPETARQAADREMIEWDNALSALRDPEAHSDEEVFAALCLLGGKKAENSPVLSGDPERGMRLFSNVWRTASAYTAQGEDLFTLCFGKKQIRQWYPLSNAVFFRETAPEDRDYELDELRSFHCRNGIWQMEAFEKLSFDRRRLQSFLHETDARLRRYLKTGRYLREDPAAGWAVPYIEAAIDSDRKALIEASRPRISIDLSSLEKIRSDALTTRDSLLTEEDLAEAEVPPKAEEGPAAPESVSAANGILPDPVLRRILQALLAGQDPSGILKENHLLPSIAADAVNEAFFDEIGDTVMICEGDTLSLLEDYVEDIRRLLGEKN